MAENSIPYGYCHCGCGRETTIAPSNNYRTNTMKGEPRNYIKGHHTRVLSEDVGPNPSGICMCGCGQPAPIASKNNKGSGWVKGQPVKFIKGHGSRVRNWPPPAKDRFWSKVNKDGPVHPVLQTACWEWTKAVSVFGYGRFHADDGDTTAHRYSYALHYGPIPDGLWVLHRCDNPRCVNPAHLFLGTRQDNIDDMIAKNRHRQGHCPAGEANPSAKLTEPEVLLIRELAAEHTPRQYLAEMFGVSLPLIEKIISRSVWSHI